MYLCKDCNSELTFRLVIDDTEDTKRKKLYLCEKCGIYHFISDVKRNFLFSYNPICKFISIL